MEVVNDPSVAHSDTPAPSPPALPPSDPQALGELPLPPGSRYLITGGGTGGHVYPAIAIADEIRRRDPSARFLYVGVKGKSESTIVPRRGYPIKYVMAEGYPGVRDPITLLRFLIKLSVGILKSMYLLLTFRPKLIIGSGGYVSAPVMLAAILLRRWRLFQGRTFIHEQNTFPGKLNRLVGARVDVVGVSFPETLKYFPVTGRFVGYPVRRELGHADVDEARLALGIPPGKKVIFAFGGSQGARTINRALIEALPLLMARDDLYIIHGTGTYKGPNYDAVADSRARLMASNLENVSSYYRQQDYFHNIEQVYAVSDLVICRGGAGTLTELAARGLPALIIPKANLPGDHQVKNARALANAGAGRVFYERMDEVQEGGLQERVPGDALAALVLELLDDPAQLQAMGRAARAYYRSDSLRRIGDALAMLLDPAHPRQTAPQPEMPTRHGPDFEDLSGGQLVHYLERQERRGGVDVPEQDLEYLQYRTDDYLASSDWEVRNRAVKLVGLLRYRERLPHILFMLRDRRPAPLLLRLLGGDFEQVGFIRRNIFPSLRRLDVFNSEVGDAILQGLADPYYEVRTEAALTARHFAERLGPARNAIATVLRRHLTDSDFEVIIAATVALGHVSTDGAIVEDYRCFLFNKNWKVRQAVVQSLGALLERRVVSRAQVQEYLDEVLITSNGFRPQFPLKAELQRVGRLLQTIPEEPLETSGEAEDLT